MAPLTAEQTTAKLIVGAEGQVRLPDQTLHHLGVGPGGKIELHLLPGGRVQIRPVRTGKIQDIFGLLAGKTTKVATIEEINDASGPDLEDFL